MTAYNKQIKENARIAFDKGNCVDAFTILSELQSVNEFISYAEKSDPKTKKKNWFQSCDCFWNDFILQNHIFVEFLKSESTTQLFYNYFKCYKKRVPEFEQKLASDYPKLFITAIRVNQVFLESGRIETLKTLKFDENFQIHQKVWQKIHEIEVSKWTEIEKELPNVLSFSLEDILSNCIIWLETNRFQHTEQQHVHLLGRVYSFFMELVLTNQPFKKMELKNNDEFFKHFSKIFAQTQKNKNLVVESPVAKLLLKITSWINFQENVVAPYSFDLTIEPKQEDELVCFNSSPEAYYKWALDGIRYEVNQIKYSFRGDEMVECLEETNQLQIPGKTEGDIEINRKLAGIKYGTFLMLQDLSCLNFKLYNGKRINVQKVLEPLLTYSYNRLLRYEYPLQKFSNTSENWSDAFIKLTYEAIKTDIVREPYFYMSVDDYKKLNQEGLSGLTEDATNEVLELFRWIPQAKHIFNRFTHNYDVWQNPFVKIGDFLFCPMMFFANNSWFYSFAQQALFQQPDNRDIVNMENYLASVFSQKGWEVKLIGARESNLLDGDVDIFIEDENDLLFVQLKRTYFRTTLKETYLESINRDLNAAKQLNNAEKYLEKSNDIYKMKQKPSKWIVSNSFENVGCKIDGCTKINYFDLLETLQNTKIKKLKEFINHLEKDEILKAYTARAFQEDLPTVVTDLIAETIKPLAVFESKKYRTVIFSDDEKRTEEYNSIFNKAQELLEKANYSEATILFFKCLVLKPNDADVHEVIGNIFAVSKNYQASFEAFEHSLKLLPNDPFTTRNYAITLMEAGYYFDGLLKLIELCTVYPMLGDIRMLIQKNISQLLKHGKVSATEITELITKWDELK